MAKSSGKNAEGAGTKTTGTKKTGTKAGGGKTSATKAAAAKGDSDKEKVEAAPEAKTAVELKRERKLLASRTKRSTENATEADRALGTNSLSSQKKLSVIEKFGRVASDCGSPEVQIALLTRRLELLTKHFATNPQDFHSQRGMMHVISKRKRLLQYLRREDVGRYKNTIAALGLRK